MISVNETKLELLLSFGNNIICQKYFNIKKVIEDVDSVQFQNSLNWIRNDITSKMKKISNNTKNDPDYKIEVICNKQPLGRIVFESTLYDYNDRYNLNIKSDIKKYINKIKETLTV